MRERYLELERKFALFLREKSIGWLRVSIAIIYFWFGLLKIFNLMPPSLEAMIAQATGWITIPSFPLVLGIWEMLIGIFLFVKKWQRWGLLLLFLQMPGTFLPLFTNPQDYFSPFPFGLTLEAQYILKNIVYIAAGLVLIGSLHKNKSASTDS